MLDEQRYLELRCLIRLELLKTLWLILVGRTRAQGLGDSEALDIMQHLRTTP